jgi:tetratricopeptide (TPR) repeat protein
MEKRSSKFTLLLGCVALGLGMSTIWAARRAQPIRDAKPVIVTPSSSTAMAPLAQNGAGSYTDHEVETWTGKLKANPTDVAAWNGLGDALMQKARETGDAAYYGRAEQAYRKALGLNPKSGDALTGMAWVTGCRHEFEQSIDWANKTLELDPRSTSAYGLLGDAAVEMGDYDTAFEQYQKMLDIHPDISSYSRGAHLLALTGDMRKGSWLMGKAILAGAPHAENTAWCRAQLALILFNEGAYVPAEQVLTTALKSTPHNYWVLYALGRVKAARRDYPAAIDYYKRAIAVVPQHDAVVALGDLYRLTGKTKEAEEAYKMVETIHQLAKANGVRGDMQIAQFDADHDRDLTRALREAETEYRTRKNVYEADTLAWCYYKNGRYAEAERAINRALSRKTPEARFLYHAGMIAAKCGHASAAKIDLYQALSLNPEFNPIDAVVARNTLHDLGTRQTALR